MHLSDMILVVALREQRVTYARVAQLVERDLAKVEAAGSSPVSRFFYFPGNEPSGHACMDICECREEQIPRCLQRGI